MKQDIMKKFKLTGGQQPCICQQWQGPVKDVLEKHDNKLTAWKEGDADPGYIIGTAIHFIPLFMYDHEHEKMETSDGVERFTCAGPWPHDNLISGLRYDDFPMAVQIHDDDQTTYGFVTSNGFFVNRHKAGHIWKEMLADSGWRDSAFEGEHPSPLFSYCLKPEVIEHAAQKANAAV